MSPRPEVTPETLGRLEELIRDLESDPHTPEWYMQEHLTEAKWYLAGAMPGEYALNLDLARKYLPEISDAGLRDRVRQFLDDVEGAGAPA